MGKLVVLTICKCAAKTFVVEQSTLSTAYLLAFSHSMLLNIYYGVCLKEMSKLPAEVIKKNVLMLQP